MKRKNYLMNKTAVLKIKPMLLLLLTIFLLLYLSPFFSKVYLFYICFDLPIFLRQVIVDFFIAVGFVIDFDVVFAEVFTVFFTAWAGV